MANANHVVTTILMTSYSGQGDTRFVAMLLSESTIGVITLLPLLNVCKEIANGGSGTDHSLLIYSVDGDLA